MTEQQFDVFLAHSSKDKPLIRQIYRKLKEVGIQPWLDEEEIAPGTKFQDEIQQAIGRIKTTAIFLGQGGLGRWQALELKSFISQCVKRDIPVIPVLLPGVEELPEELIFLQEFHAVLFRDGMEDENALFSLEWGITGKKPTRQSGHPQAASVGWALPITPEDDLSSEKGIDYSKLRDLLKAGQWQDADNETYETMIRAASKESGKWFIKDDLINFPCTDLLTIDRLWVKYSGGEFGFSVQKKIWQECGSPTSSGKNWDKFCVRVGWQDAKATRYLTSEELKANPQNSPTGEFPSWFVGVYLCGGVGQFANVFSFLASRFVNCSR
jgi:hypothetical protein